MAQSPPIAPLVLKPARINNYTHLIALLRLKQDKCKGCGYKQVNHDFAKVLGARAEGFNAEEIIEGFLHQKLRERYEQYAKEVSADFDKLVSRKIKEIKKENDQKIYSVKIGSIKDVEEALFNKPTKHAFKDELLYDLYVFLNEHATPMDFLHGSYLKYIKAFMSMQKAAAQKEGHIDDNALMGLVAEFARLRFNREEFCIEAYEGRYLWAEVFVLFRIGRSDLVKQLLAEYEIFFEFMAQKFRTLFLDFLHKGASSFTFSIGQNEDRFKRFLFGLAEGKVRAEGTVICTVEDYLWMKMLVAQDPAPRGVLQDLTQFENPKVAFMACLLTGKYKRSIDVLLKSDFSLVAKFFLLKELCLEQMLDAAENDDGSLGRGAEGLLRTNPVFLNFMFSIVARMSTKEKKVKFIEMLKHHGNYYKVVPRYIIKYDLFDIVGRTAEAGNELEYYLDNELAACIIEELKAAGNKSKLVKLHRLIPDEMMVRLLIDTVEEGILIDEQVDAGIVENYIGRAETREAAKLAHLYRLYRFNTSPDIVSLRATIIFDSSADLSEYKFAIEKVLPSAIDVIKAEHDREMAKSVFKLCGMLDLNEECCSKASKELVALI